MVPGRLHVRMQLGQRWQQQLLLLMMMKRICVSMEAANAVVVLNWKMG